METYKILLENNQIQAEIETYKDRTKWYDEQVDMINKKYGISGSESRPNFPIIPMPQEKKIETPAYITTSMRKRGPDRFDLEDKIKDYIRKNKYV